MCQIVNSSMIFRKDDPYRTTPERVIPNPSVPVLEAENPRRDAWGSSSLEWGSATRQRGVGGMGTAASPLTNSNLAANHPTSTVHSDVAGISMTIHSIPSYRLSAGLRPKPALPARDFESIAARAGQDGSFGR